MTRHACVGELASGRPDGGEKNVMRFGVSPCSNPEMTLEEATVDFVEAVVEYEEV